MTYLAKIEQLNSADLAAYRPLILDGDPVGLIWRDNLARLRDHGLDLRDDGDRLIWYAPADFAAQQRAARFLAYRGFDHDTIRHALDKAWQDEEEWDE